MRFAHTLFVVLTILIFSGCSEKDTNKVVGEEEKEVEDTAVENEKKEKEEDVTSIIEKLTEYEKIVLEDVDDDHEIVIEYPKFDYEPLDDFLEVKKEEFEGQINQYEMNKSDGINDSFNYHSLLNDVIITENTVSILSEGRFYQGGGFDFADTLNFDLENEQEITIEDVLEEKSIPLEGLANLVAEKLLTDDEYSDYREEPLTDTYKEGVMEETMPELTNFSEFTLTDESITIYKPYTSIFPNSKGITGVEVSWKEITEEKKYIEEELEKTIDENNSEIAVNTYLYSAEVNEYGEITVVIDIENNGDKAIKVNQHDFILEHLEHEGEHSTTVQGYEPEEIELNVGESDFFISYFNVGELLYPDDPDVVNANDFQILYSGDLKEVENEIFLNNDFPLEFEDDVQERIEKIKQGLQENEQLYGYIGA